MSVKRYGESIAATRDGADFKLIPVDEPELGLWVKAKDYDALLSVLRQCVEKVERMRPQIMPPYEWEPDPTWYNKAIDEIVSIARPYLESKEEEPEPEPEQEDEPRYVTREMALDAGDPTLEGQKL